MSFRSALASGVPQLGLSVMYPGPGVIERIGADWDWMWIDGQHGQLGYSEILGLIRACDLVQRPAIVRVPGHEFGPIGLALDAGAAGIIAPCVNAAKFPPLGKRSYGGRRPIDRLGRTYSDNANEEVLLVAQIETPEAIQNVEAIAAVPGVDALFLGPDDLMLRRGHSMTAPRSKETLGRDMELVANACRKHGKFSVMVGVGDEMLRHCASLGYNMIVSGSDVLFLAAGSKRAASDARTTLNDLKAAPKPQQGAAAGVAGSPY